jgi:hypothetical protein
MASMSFKTKNDILSKNKPGFVHPAGSEAFPVEQSKKDSDLWIIEIRAPDPTLIGGAWYETFELSLSDLDV